MSRCHFHKNIRGRILQPACMLLAISLPALSVSAVDSCLGGHHVCVADDAAAVTVWVAKRGPKLGGQSTALEPATLDSQRRCIDSPVDVTAGSPDERSLACSAANVALELLSRCKISPQRPVHVQIVDEVQHPFRGPIFGHFDAKQEREFWSRSMRTFRLWSKTLPMASSRSAISTRA